MLFWVIAVGTDQPSDPEMAHRPVGFCDRALTFAEPRRPLEYPAQLVALATRRGRAPAGAAATKPLTRTWRGPASSGDNYTQALINSPSDVQVHTSNPAVELLYALYFHLT